MKADKPIFIMCQNCHHKGRSYRGRIPKACPDCGHTSSNEEKSITGYILDFILRRDTDKWYHRTDPHGWTKEKLNITHERAL